MHFLCRYTEKNEPTAAVNLTRYPFFFPFIFFMLEIAFALNWDI